MATFLTHHPRRWIPPGDALCWFWSGRRERARNDQGFEAALVVRAVAERLVGGLTAAAEGDQGAARQIERLPLLIDDREVSLDPDGTVVANRDGGSRHESSWGSYEAAEPSDPAPRLLRLSIYSLPLWHLSTSSP